MNRSIQSKTLSIARACSFSLTILTLALGPSISIGSTKVNIEIGGVVGSSCRGPSDLSCIAGPVGSVFILVISTDEQPPFKGYSSVKPTWLDFEFGFTNGAGEFMPSDELKSLLAPEFFLTADQHETNDAHARGESVNPAQSAPIYYFRVTFPNEYADTTICVRPSIEVPPYGPVVSEKSQYDCVRIVSPACAEDSQIVFDSYLYDAERVGDYLRVIAIADSLLHAGTFSSSTLRVAKGAARKEGKYSDALRYLDLSFEVFGPDIRYRMSDIPPFELMPVGTYESAIAQYRSERESLISMINAQGRK